jgi:hypothetical protein
VKTTIAFVVLLLIVSYCASCVTGQSVEQANQAAIEAAAPPDFYDREGNACWRMADFVWCDDGYNSWGEGGPWGEDVEEDEPINPDELITQVRHHTHTWMQQSENEDSNGKVVCSWACIADSSHIAITSGYGYCPYPR